MISNVEQHRKRLGELLELIEKEKRRIYSLFHSCGVFPRMTQEDIMIFHGTYPGFKLYALYVECDRIACKLRRLGIE